MLNVFEDFSAKDMKSNSRGRFKVSSQGAKGRSGRSMEWVLREYKGSKGDAAQWHSIKEPKW